MTIEIGGLQESAVLSCTSKGCKTDAALSILSMSFNYDESLSPLIYLPICFLFLWIPSLILVAVSQNPDEEI